MSTIHLVLRASAFLLTILTLAACAGDRFADFQWPAGEAARPNQPAINITGRWTLTSPNRGQCKMTFTGTGGVKATEGAIAPEGGCPGNFYTSRKWALEQGNVIIRDHNDETLAQLTPNGTGWWFDGHATTGEPIMLAR